ncbi:MAG: IS3 family transposase [Geodermatophilaceae bacterium]
MGCAGESSRSAGCCAEHGWQIAPATYYAAKTRPPSARAVRDGELKPMIAAVHEANYGVYGVRKIHAELRRDGHRGRPGPGRHG